MCVLHATPQWDLASRYSSWPKLLRITAYFYRFLSRLRLSKHSNIAFLFPEEIQNAKRYSKTMQSDMFPNEIAGLKQKRLVPKSSPLSVLNSYINENGLIRI